MSQAKKFFVTAKEATPLKELLTHHLPGDCDVSCVIDAGGVWMNRQRLIDPNLLITSGQTIIAYISAVQGKYYDLSATQIVDETKDFVIVHKPPGLTTVSDRSNQTYNLMAALERWYAAKGESVTLSPITRLDHMVSGLTLITKHTAATRDFSKQTQQRKIGKYYVARLPHFGDAPKCLRCIDHLGHAGKAFLDPKGKRCESLFILRHSNVADSYIEYGVKLFTGRRHQIRFHAATYLRPLLGDGLYGDKRTPRSTPISLWAHGLNFKYKGVRYRYRLPAEAYATMDLSITYPS